ncbi:hypothetical protein [Tellurirhabdus bombi]|uniref:hypothetical protein n=1 Tax=Tellurirhabdus bombi TaxID=2907205 RepID=UPI001F2C4D47|nr:hypothetical protein [Tellurirhabdus bombi]
MLKYSVHGLTFNLYDSIKELPSSVYQKAKQYDVLASELAYTKEMLDQQKAQLGLLRELGSKPQAAQLEINIRLSEGLIEANFRPDRLAWATYVKWNRRMSESELDEHITELLGKGLTDEYIGDMMSRVNQKISGEVRRYFKSRNKQGKTLNEAERYRQYLLAKLTWYQEPTDENKQKYKSLLRQMLEARPILSFDGEDSVIVELEKNYAKLCVSLTECGCPDPARLTVFELYTWLETQEEKYEAHKKALTKDAPKRR